MNETEKFRKAYQEYKEINGIIIQAMVDMLEISPERAEEVATRIQADLAHKSLIVCNSEDIEYKVDKDASTDSR